MSYKPVNQHLFLLLVHFWRWDFGIFFFSNKHLERIFFIMFSLFWRKVHVNSQLPATLLCGGD